MRRNTVGRVHTWQRTIFHCPAHIGLSGPPHLAVLFDENGRLNVTTGLFQDIRAEVRKYDLRYYFNADRRLTVFLRKGIPPFSPAELSQLQDSCDIQFGPDKVLASEA